MDTHRDVFIVLKESLKWVPVLGWVRKSASSGGDMLISGVRACNSSASYSSRARGSQTAVS
jgi:hypothetical protein